MIFLEQHAPSLLLALEPYHAACNFLAGHAWRMEPMDAGDGHPVLVYPGLGVSGAATTEMRTRLLALGYQVYDWELGVGRWPCTSFDDWIALLASQVHQIVRAHCRPVSLVGWSLGGLFARELARHVPQQVRQVITLGTPVAGGLSAGEMTLLASMPARLAADAELVARLQQLPPVPCASIYSRTDGLVDWRKCIDPHLPPSHNIEVRGASHFGLVHHPGVLAAVAALLARQPGKQDEAVQEPASV